MTPTLTNRALSRATLARQHLLERARMPIVAMVEAILGLQAQTPWSWYTGLWNRVADFEPTDVSALIEGRALVRIALMRSTIHLVSARDALALRPLLGVVGERGFKSNFGRNLVGTDLAEVAAAGRASLDDTPATFSELGERLAERWPGRDPASLAQAVRAYVPLVQVPPRGLWGRSGAARHAPAESWLGRPLEPTPSLDAMILRYLGAFGPASVKDIQVWSGLTRLAEPVRRLQDRLVRFEGEDGRELFDLPEAPRPGADTPAPVRFLYDYDNIGLSYADRSRFSLVPGTLTAWVFTKNGVLPGTVLVDGSVRCAWHIAEAGDRATLTVRTFLPLSATEQREVEAEAERVLTFEAAGAVRREVRFGTFEWERPPPG